MFTYPITFLGQNTGGTSTPTKRLQVVLSSSFPTAMPITAITITKCPLRYDKKHAITYEMDDHLREIYTNVFKLFNGGLPADDTVVSDGMFTTDGFGNDVKFHAAAVGFYYLTNGTIILDTTYAGTTYFNWDKHREMYDAGWGILGNHGAWANYKDVSEADMITYETAMKARFIQKYGRPPLHAIMQGGIEPYFDEQAWAAWLTANCNIYLKVMGSGAGISEIDLTGLNLIDYITVNGETVTTGRYKVEDDHTNAYHMANIDYVMNKTGNWWLRTYSHRVAASNYQIPYSDFKLIWEYIENTYGKFGSDIIWVPSLTEMIEYLVTKEKAVITSNETLPRKHDLSFDYSQVPSNIFNRSQTFKVSSNIPIVQIIAEGYNVRYKGIGTTEVTIDLQNILAIE